MSKPVTGHDKDVCPLPHCFECAQHIDIDDSSHIYPWSAYEHFGCQTAKRELIRSGDFPRTDRGFKSQPDNKARMGERVTTAELEGETWGDPSEWDEDA